MLSYSHNNLKNNVGFNVFFQINQNKLNILQDRSG